MMGGLWGGVVDGGGGGDRGLTRWITLVDRSGRSELLQVRDALMWGCSLKLILNLVLMRLPSLRLL